MPDIGVAGWGVIAAFTIGLLTLAVTIVLSFRAEGRAERTRRLERKTDAYLRLLQLCHMRDVAIDAVTSNLNMHYALEAGFGQRREVLKISEESNAEMYALRDAFSSSAVAEAHYKWNESVLAFERELEMVQAIANEEQDLPDTGKLERLAVNEADRLLDLGELIRTELRF